MKLLRRKRRLDFRESIILILFLLLLMLLITNYPTSVTNQLSATGDPPKYAQKPGEFTDLPFQNMSNMPPIAPPSGGSFPNNSNTFIPPSGVTPTGTLPPVSTIPPIPSSSLPSNPMPSNPIPSNPIPSNPTLPNQPNPTNPVNNPISNTEFTVPKRPIKARYIELPKMLRISWQITVTTENLAFFLLLLFSFVFPKIIIPKLENIERKNKQRQNSIFVQKSEQQLQEKSERKLKLATFKEHVEHIITQTRERMNNVTEPNYVKLAIIKGYLELDEAFHNFSDLQRADGMTPLEHAQQIFAERELNNTVLEAIVNLFYLARYGEKELTIKQGRAFLQNLQNLLLEEPTNAKK